MDQRYIRKQEGVSGETKVSLVHEDRTHDVWRWQEERENGKDSPCEAGAEKFGLNGIEDSSNGLV